MYWQNKKIKNLLKRFPISFVSNVLIVLVKNCFLFLTSNIYIHINTYLCAGINCSLNSFFFLFAFYYYYYFKTTLLITRKTLLEHSIERPFHHKRRLKTDPFSLFCTKKKKKKKGNELFRCLPVCPIDIQFPPVYVYVYIFLLKTLPRHADFVNYNRPVHRPPL